MIQNKAEFNKLDLLTLFGNYSLINFPNNLTCMGVSIDTRIIKPGELFVALIGENSDGHIRISEAYEKGAAAAIVNQKWFKDNSGSVAFPVIVVKDTLHALGKLAKYHRKRFNIPVIAIGGSNGKTTTKNMTAHLLSQKFSILKTHENFNNQVGVPLMLLQLDSTFNAAVLEMGTNEPGEISILSSIMEPTHGLITNIGREHLEKLIDLDGVELEETYLFGFLMKRNGLPFINFDDARLKQYSRLFEKYVSFGISDEADVRVGITFDSELHPVLKFTIEGRQLSAKLQTIGYTTALNAIAAVAIGISFGMNGEEIITGIESYKPEEAHGYARMLLEHVGSITLINDCYNANPDSMQMALKTLKDFDSKGRRFAVLGDMRELGEASFAEHCNILERAKISADFTYLFGKEMKIAYEKAANTSAIKHFEIKEEISNELKTKLQAGDILLVKGSRGMSMETIINELKTKG